MCWSPPVLAGSGVLWEIQVIGDCLSKFENSKFHCPDIVEAFHLVVFSQDTDILHRERAPMKAQPPLRLPGLSLSTDPRAMEQLPTQEGRRAASLSLLCPWHRRVAEFPAQNILPLSQEQAFISDEEFNLNPSCLPPLPELRTDSHASLYESRNVQPTFCVLTSSVCRLPVFC